MKIDIDRLDRQVQVIIDREYPDMDFDADFTKHDQDELYKLAEIEVMESMILAAELLEER